MKKPRKNIAPRRTREHRIADLSAHHVEGFVLRKGYTVEGFRHDYGYDLALFTYDYQGGEEGEYEPDSVKIQLKATDHITVLEDGETISFTIQVRHLNLWRRETMPVILIVFDAQAEVAYWLDIQDYVKSSKFKGQIDQDSVNLHLSRQNRVNEDAIERFRQLKRERHAYWEKLEKLNENPRTT